MHTIALHRPFELRMPRINLSLRSAIAAVVMATMVMAIQGCAHMTSKQAIALVGNAIPTIKADIDIAANVITMLDPAATLIVAGAVAIADPALVTLQALCNTYATTSDPTVLGSINETLNKLLNQSAASILDAAKITNPESRATALRVLTAIQIALQLAYTIYQNVQSKAAITQTASMRTFKLKEIAPYLTDTDRDRIETATGYDAHTAIAYAQAQGF